MSALGLGAMFLEGRHPRVPEWMNVAKQTYDDFYDTCAKDGSYEELLLSGFSSIERV